MERVNWQRTRDILISIICIGIILWFAWGLLLGLFVHAVVLLLLSLAVAFLLTPAVNFLESRGLPRVVATLSMVIIVIAVLGALAYALVFSLIQQVLTFQATITNFFNALPVQYETFLKFLRNQGIPEASISSALNQIQNQATDFARTAASNVLNMAFIVTNTLIDFLLILVLSFYFTLDGKKVRDGLVSIAPKSWMPHVLLFEDALNRVVGNYIRGQLTLAVIIGILAGMGCALLGLSPYALIIGVMAFLFETIPMVGPALASIPAILLSLLLPDPFPRTIWIIIYFIIVQMVESNILGPRIVGHAVGLHPVASILALIIGAQLFGAFGALLATPIVAAAWVVIASLYRSARGETADEILANKRTGWVIRRRKTQFLGDDNKPDKPGDEQHTSPGIQANDEVEKDEHRGSDQIETNPAHIKGSSMHLEHIDLLRPIPDDKVPPGSKAKEEEQP